VHRACRARSVSPARSPGSCAPSEPRPCRGRSPWMGAQGCRRGAERDADCAGVVAGGGIGERPLQGRDRFLMLTRGFAPGCWKRPYRPRADGNRFSGVMGWCGSGPTTGSGSRWLGWVGESGVRVRLGAMTTSGRERVALLWLFLPLGLPFGGRGARRDALWVNAVAGRLGFRWLRFAGIAQRTRWTMPMLLSSCR